MTIRPSEPLRSAFDHTPTGAEFAALRARRRRRMEAPVSAGQLAAVGTLGANLIESAPRARGPRRRGDIVTGPGGVVGRWVGAANGVQCIAWQGEDFEKVCKAFDAKPRR